MTLLESATRKRSDSEMVIHRLYEITSHFDAGFDQQIRELLQLGCDRFGLDIGIVARIEGANYEVYETVGPAGIELSKGDRFELGNTYCSITLGADGPVGFEQAGASTYARHPAYGMFKLEAYIGIPIYVAGDLFGTINFSSANPRKRTFETADVDCLKLMQSWLAIELQRRRTEAELEEARRHLEHLVRIDPLTELANRRGVVEMLEGCARRSGHDGAALSCVLVDIDDFKLTNDRFGHSTGDRVIQAVAQAVKDSVRPTDLAGRIGGDEFLAVLPGASVHVAKRIADRIIARIRALRHESDGKGVPISASIGVSEVPTDVANVTDLLVRTEALLRQSKLAGKDTVTAA